MTSTVQYIGWMEIRRRAANGTLALAILLLSTFATTRSAQAQTFTVLYTFTGMPDGSGPSGSLVGDPAGNLYGTTQHGGHYGGGTVFKLDAIGNETVLHSFTGADGAYLYAGLVRDAAGNLYGTADKGGAFHHGTVFKLNTAGKFKVLHSFAGADGTNPYGALILVAGNLYGTTTLGGDLSCNNGGGCGTVFKLDATGKETVLHRFVGADGSHPTGSLVGDAADNLYGTTELGGDLACNAPYGCGTVFKLDATGNETVLHSFGGADGAYPFAGLVRDAAGNLYGTTVTGGDYDIGTVFKLDATGKETVLHSFAWADGALPYAGVIRDASGNLYGATAQGGASGSGTVFKLDATSNETVLHSFAGADEAGPLAGLIRAAGNLYGTTVAGGDYHIGTVFKLTP